MNSELNEIVGSKNCMKPQEEPFLVAVCGIGLRLPGGIRHTRDFWDVLINGKDMISSVPEARYNPDGFDDSLGSKTGIRTKKGYFLDDDLCSLDPSITSMTRMEIERCDPQQRQLLEVTKEALDDAGEIDYRGQQIGCYVGAYTTDWTQMMAKELQHHGGYVLSGQHDYLLANRISYEYDFRGPSITIKAACSSAIIALYDACRALQNDDAKAAIVASSSLVMITDITASFESTGIISPESPGRTFDADASGFGRAEAINAVYVKPLSSAKRDGNPIRAVIRAIATNSNGKGIGITNPSHEAQEALIRETYKKADLDPSQTALVECHGTATAAGDVLEAKAIGEVFGNEGVYIGAVKPNIGHSEGASGLNSLIKAVLALENRIIPPNIKFLKPNPSIPFVSKGLKVPTVPTAFPDGRAERVSVNSFGLGGTNAHVILESYRCESVQHRTRPRPRPEILVFSANTQPSLERQVQQYEEYLHCQPHLRAADLAYTLGTRRERLAYRAFAILDDGKFIEIAKPVKAAAIPQNLYFIFNGQGSQWIGMGKELFEIDVFFRKDIMKMQETLSTLKYPPKWSLSEILQSTENSIAERPEVSQPLCTALQVALVNMLQRVGVKATAVIGHSSGEIAAAYASGGLSMSDAIIAAYYRGYVMQFLTSAGAMAAVGLDAEHVAKYLNDNAQLACENSPQSVTISGDAVEIAKVTSQIELQDPNIPISLLKVGVAYHSHHMVIPAAEYERVLGSALKDITNRRRTMSTLFVSTVTGKPVIADHAFDERYWAQNLRLPVRFSAAVKELIARKGNGVFLEVGPHASLSGPLRQICADLSKTFNYVPTIIRYKNSFNSMLSAIGRLYQEGYPVNLAKLYSASSSVLSGLPPYAWDHSERFWYESRLSRDWRHRKFAHHCLLGLRTLESPETAPQWRNILSLDNEPWLADHKIGKDVIFPLACFISVIGEAIRQVSSSRGGYSIRHMVLHNSLLLLYGQNKELVTSLSPQRLTDSEDSGWFEFSISSYSGSGWVKHVTGEARLCQHISPRAIIQGEYSRKLEPSDFYEAMNDREICLGSTFQTLTHITSSATAETCAAQILPPQGRDTNAYTMHPLILDACLQLSIIAPSKGLCRDITRPIPIRIESLNVLPYVAGPVGSTRVQSQSSITECFAGENTVLRLAGVETTALESSLADPHAAARLEWLPHFDFADRSALIKPPEHFRQQTQMLEEMALLCMMESSAKLATLKPGLPYFQKMLEWLQNIVHNWHDFRTTLNMELSKLFAVPKEERTSMINLRFKALLETSSSAIAEGIKLIYDNCEGIFTGEVNAISTLMPNGILTRIYDALSFDYGDFVRLLSHSRPKLRVLEVGAGTGSTTELILRNITREGGLPLYSSYTFTDISSGFFPSAKQRFSYAPNMEYMVFDITKDPSEQGISPDSYDLVIAANVVHATPSLKESLGNINKILRPGGLLLMTEVCTELQFPTYIFGNFEGWWLGAEDGRADRPFVETSRWHDELQASGFTGVENAVYDEETPYNIFVTIVSRRLPEVKPRNQMVSIITAHPQGEVATLLVEALKSKGFVPTPLKLKQKVPQDQDVIVCLDLEENFFESISKKDFYDFQTLIRTLTAQQKLLWITNPAQVNCRDPRSAHAIGVARSVRTELEVPFYTLEIDSHDKSFSDIVLQVFHKIRQDDDDQHLDSDKEFVVDHSAICVGRFQPFSALNELAQCGSPDGVSCLTLEVKKVGMIESLRWTRKSLSAALPPDAIEVEVRSFGLNLRDVLLVKGSLKFPGLVSPELGIDGAGIVTKVGINVTTFVPGDRVLIFAPDGCFSTKVVVQHQMAAKIPVEMSFEEASTLPAVFITATHALLEIGHVKKSQRVLIHSACGGVGMAAIQVCQWIGAEIYATVGSDAKVGILIEKFGISRDRIFNSRDDRFLQGIMAATDGYGMDVVLNSLAGPQLHASWQCVAEHGIMIEIGKRDVLGHGRLDMYPFYGSRRFVYLDCLDIARRSPEIVSSAFHILLTEYEKHNLGRIPYITSFEAEKSVDAFRHLQNSSHIGKVSISINKDLAANATPRATPLVLDHNATYILTGGLGGLGRSIATWLVERGARSLTFLSRSAGVSEASKDIRQEIEGMGCQVTMITGAVQNETDVKAAICASPLPVRGVIHLAMVLRDSSMINMKWEQWDEVMKPKVDGAWNLHRALMDQPLDFFMITDTMASVLHQQGQGNYLATSTFLNAFCQYRMQLGQPTSVLNICPIRGVGYIAQNAVAQRNVERLGAYSVGEKEFLQLVELSIFTAKAGVRGPIKDDVLGAQAPTAWKNISQILMGLRSNLHLQDPENRSRWRRDRRMGSYHNSPIEQTRSVTKESSPLEKFLIQVSQSRKILSNDESIDFLAQEIGSTVYNLLLKPGENISVKQSLAEMGLDSLMATELRQWFLRALRMEVSVMEMMAAGSLSELARTIASRLQERNI